MRNADVGGQNAEPSSECIGLGGTHLRSCRISEQTVARGLAMGRISSAKAPTPPEGGVEGAKEPGHGYKIGLRADQEMLWKIR
jgi:hypothetical protein